MKKTIIVGSLLACFLMLMIPNVSAIEYRTVEEVHKSQIMDKLQGIALADLMEGMKDRGQ